MNSVFGKLYLFNNNTDKAYCFYNNNANGEKDIYEALYTYAAAVNGTPHNGTDNLQGVCPAGWHLPSDAEWTVLTDFLGGSDVAGGKLKETRTTLWISPNTVGTNESGFSALPGSARNNLSGSFFGVGYNSFWWTSTEGGTSNYAYYRQLYKDEALLYRINDYKSPGRSVRCVKD